MVTEAWNWTYKDLQKLIGQAESFTLDFKQSKLFNESREKIALNLTKEVSAFANSEGGVIVIGIAEKRIGKSRIADHIDSGVDIHHWSPEMIQQLIESNVRPHLTGLRINPISVSSDNTQFAYVIYVPSGSTAYQAKDYRYYGRSEYECRPLPDHEIRLRMFRGKVPNATVQIGNIKKTVIKIPVTVTKAQMTTEEECSTERAVIRLNNTEKGENRYTTNKLNRASKKNAAAEKSAIEKLLTERFENNPTLLKKLEELDSNDTIPVTVYTFDTIVKNIGEVNITEFTLKVDFPPDNPFYLKSYTKRMKEGWLDRSSKKVIGLTTAIASRMQVNIFPQDTLVVERTEVLFFWDQIPHLQDLYLRWTLYLSDTFPVDGEIVLQQPFNF